MRVPVSMLRRMAPVQLAEGPVPVALLAEVMNARVSEVEHVHRFPTRAALAGVHTRRGPDGLLVVVHPDGRDATEASLGIGADSSLPLTLAPEILPDADLHLVLGLDDAVLEFDLEPNRPDLFSLLGMARDAAAIWDSQLLPPPATPRPWPDSELRVAVQATEKVPRYTAVELVGLKVGPSPQWLQNAVRKLGMRPINNVVDATNLVMMELGEPMHTFDRARIGSGVIGLRMAHPGERMKTLDGVERLLTEECLLVVDGDPDLAEGGVPVALAGIMGSEGSGIRPDTTEVLIEAACFDMATVRRASRRLSLRTEASLRFEKGLPQGGVGPAMERLVSLLEEVCGPDVRVKGRVEHWPAPPPPRTLRVDPDRVRRRMAMEISDERIHRILASSGCTVDRRIRDGALGWTVFLPEHRPDLTIAEDLDEEVGRLHGYEHVDARLPLAQLRPVRPNPWFVGASRAREALLAWGLDEVALSAWLSDAELSTYGLPAPGEGSPLVELSNPLNVELRYFRPTALPAVIEAVRENRKQLGSFGLFEIGRVYSREASGAIVERPSLCGAVLDPASQAQGGAFYRVRDALLDLGRQLGLALRVEPELAEPEAIWATAWLLHPGRRAALVDDRGRQVGVLGELHPATARAADLREAPAVFAVDLGLLQERLDSQRRRFQPPPRFPGVQAHLNVLAPARLTARELLGQVRAPDLVHKDVRDVWAGKGVPPGQRRLTLELEFLLPDRSLTHVEVLERLQIVAVGLRTDPRLAVELQS